jgi:hypothetical protein
MKTLEERYEEAVDELERKEEELKAAEEGRKFAEEKLRKILEMLENE